MFKYAHNPDAVYIWFGTSFAPSCENATKMKNCHLFSSEHNMCCTYDIAHVSEICILSNTAGFIDHTYNTLLVASTFIKFTFISRIPELYKEVSILHLLVV